MSDKNNESCLRAEGTVEIEVDAGFRIPNVYYVFYIFESVFPYAEATSRITCGSNNTDIETKVTKVAKLTDAADRKGVYHPAAALGLGRPCCLV